MRYEDAREELIAIVAQLEAGQARSRTRCSSGVAARHWPRTARRWLDGAQAEIERATRPPAAAGELHADDEIFDEDDES